MEFVKTRISDMSEQGRKNLAEYRLSISLFTFESVFASVSLCCRRRST